MKNALLSILICAFAYTFSSCESKNQSSDAASTETAKAEVTPLNPAQFQEKSGAGIVLDVRTPEEVAAGKIPGAMAIDFYQTDFLTKVGELPKDREIYLYCAVGGRSSQAAEQLIQQGFTKVYHLEGGIRGWQSAGLPITQE